MPLSRAYQAASLTSSELAGWRPPYASADSAICPAARAALDLPRETLHVGFEQRDRRAVELRLLPFNDGVTPLASAPGERPMPLSRAYQAASLTSSELAGDEADARPDEEVDAPIETGAGVRVVAGDVPRPVPSFDAESLGLDRTRDREVIRSLRRSIEREWRLFGLAPAQDARRLAGNRPGARELAQAAVERHLAARVSSGRASASSRRSTPRASGSIAPGTER
jgi:hypothetical protein